MKTFATFSVIINDPSYLILIVVMTLHFVVTQQISTVRVVYDLDISVLLTLCNHTIEDYDVITQLRCSIFLPQIH